MVLLCLSKLKSRHSIGRQMPVSLSIGSQMTESTEAFLSYITLNSCVIYRQIQCARPCTLRKVIPMTAFYYASLKFPLNPM